MKKRNLWNRIFHSEELKKEHEEYEKAKSLVGFGSETLQFIEGAKDLDELLKAHKIAWSRGYRNENLGPCSYGIFRTHTDIESMTADEVYLGDIWGLWTHNIPFWNDHKEETMSGNGFEIPEDTLCYDLIMRQYRNLLRKNIQNIINESREYIRNYENL